MILSVVKVGNRKNFLRKIQTKKYWLFFIEIMQTNSVFSVGDLFGKIDFFQRANDKWYFFFQKDHAKKINAYFFTPHLRNWSSLKKYSLINRPFTIMSMTNCIYSITLEITGLNKQKQIHIIITITYNDIIVIKTN